MSMLLSHGVAQITYTYVDAEEPGAAKPAWPENSAWSHSNILDDKVCVGREVWQHEVTHLDGHNHGSWHRSVYTREAQSHRELVGRSQRHHSGKLIHQSWLASRSDSSLDDKVLHTDEGHSGASFHKSKDTCALCPRRKDLNLLPPFSLLYK